ncbi:hypothetical protein H0H92_014230 [Tricholoma furcatifolium]|nr:hypothetical protein H0H92_014230 [Tricholoma furcatifolium]
MDEVFRFSLFYGLLSKLFSGTRTFLFKLWEMEAITGWKAFGTRVVKAVWDSTRSLYEVTFEDVKTGSRSTTCAEILVSALGILEVPKFPDIAGLSSFKGQMFHSARWIDTNLDNKRVAIVGNGSSAITRRWVQRRFEQFVIKTSPEEYHEFLIPKYELGCRRIVFDQGYLTTLHYDNVRLVYDGIDSIVEDGIVTKGKHHSFDTIILATGYHTDTYPLHVEGKNGQTVQEYFDSKRGPVAYRGTSIPGFPNFYMICGPNTATGHTSVIFTEEVQINYSLDLIKPILEGKARSIDVKHAATDRWNEDLQARLSRSVFNSGCSHSWYRVNGTGKINTMFPGSAAEFWWCLWRPNWRDYEVMGGDAGTGKGSEFVKMSILGLGIAVAVAAVPWYVMT